MDKPRNWYDLEFWNAKPAAPGALVYEPEPRVIETGILDQHGRKIVRTEKREPIGYVHFPERA